MTEATLDKTAIKQKIQELKKERQSALESGDAEQLRKKRREIRKLKRSLRSAPAREPEKPAQAEAPAEAEAPVEEAGAKGEEAEKTEE